MDFLSYTIQIKSTLKNSFRHITIFLYLLLLVSSCSRKKDRFLNRNWHALNTRYNILFNGEMALVEGLDEVQASYTDNYWELLPVERLSFSDSFGFEEKEKNPNFERAEEKAVKAVQTHGMKIKGKEKNAQIDEAYLLLGKARYFSGRFIPALEAFNYILFKYPGSSNINSAKIWRAKANLRLENETIAKDNLNALLLKKDLSDDNKVEAYATLAQLYINSKEFDMAVLNLENAANITKDKAFKGRLHFIKGQLHNAQGQKQSAMQAFQRVIELKRNVPRPYRVNAFLEQIKNFDYKTGDQVYLSEFLESLVLDRENRPYLDRIYHVIANHHLVLEQDSAAIAYFNKSLRTKSKDNYLNAINYHSIADLYFDDSNYVQAGSYYDSTLVNYTKNTKPYRAVKKRLDNLEDLIRYEAIAQANDSILKLVAMPEQVLEDYFKKYISSIKAKAKIENKITKQPKQLMGATTKIKGPSIEKGNGFYFYQATNVAYGKNEFISLWGDRPLEDNWRWSDKKIINRTKKGAASTDVKADAEETLSPNFFIKQLPTEIAVIDSIADQRNFAYYQLGLIYRNKFNEYDRSKTKLEALLQQNPQKRLILPAKYNLYKVYNLLGDSIRANSIKQNIISEFADSRYAQILLNPLSTLEDDNQSSEARYKRLFKDFESSKYEKVIAGCELEITRFEGEAIVPKLELLKTSAKGRLYGFEAYKTGLNYIALNHPNSPEGKQAQNLTDKVLKSMEDDTFDMSDTAANFKTIFPFSTGDTEAIKVFKNLLLQAIKEETVFRLSISEEIYDINTTFVIIHGLKSFGGAMGFVELLDNETLEIEANNYFSISSTNYKTLQIHKNLESYLKEIKN